MRETFYGHYVRTGETELLRPWHPIRKKDLTLGDLTYGSKRKVLRQCPEGHIWKSAIYSRAGPKKCGCPVCAGRVREQKRKLYRSIQAAGKALAAQAALK